MIEQIDELNNPCFNCMIDNCNKCQNKIPSFVYGQVNENVSKSIETYQNRWNILKDPSITIAHREFTHRNDTIQSGSIDFKRVNYGIVGLYPSKTNLKKMLNLSEKLRNSKNKNKSTIIKCPRCGEHGYKSPHHIIPKACGGKDDKDNIVILCRKCHDEIEEITQTIIEEGMTINSKKMKQLIKGDMI